MTMRTTPTIFLLAALSMLALTATAKPISFADGWTFMHERDSDMIETNLYYSPTHWVSFGPSIARSRADDGRTRRDAQTMHVNLLAKRWNLADAQANIFTSYGLGRTETRGVANRTETAHHATLQGDYETRQFYTSFKFDAHRSPTFLDRTDTLQIGASPYAHDYDDLAFWVIAQVKKYRGLNDKTEAGAFIRLFRKNVWVELGLTEGRKSQMMLMINY